MRNIVLIIIFTIILIIVVAIIDVTPTADSYSQNEQFIFIDNLYISNLVVSRYYDKDTKVIYMFTRNDYSQKGGGLTVMVDSNGKPLLYEEKNNNE